MRVLKRNLLFVSAVLLCACSEPVETNTDNIVITPFIAEAQQVAKDKFGSELSFEEMYKNKDAVCGVAKKGDGDAQQFIYNGRTFLIEESFEPAEWEEQWFSQCDDG